MTKRQDIVLVVDDDRAVRDSLKFALEIEGLLVRVCSGGAELLVHPDLLQACCIVLDYKMPEMDGLAVLALLAAQDLAIPVIVITAHATKHLRDGATKAGVRHILEKPLFNGGLLDSIHAILGHQALRIIP